MTNVHKITNPVVTRVVSTNKVVQADLAIGAGTVEQTRGSKITTERQIEVMWIFRSLDDLRALEIPAYTRVGIHTHIGPLKEYVFDADNGAPDNGDTIICPINVIGLGRWVHIPVVDIEARWLIEELRRDLPDK